MKNLAKLLCIVVVLLAIPAVVFAARDSRGSSYYDDGSGITGKIVSIDKNDHAFQIYDQSRHYYTVLADGARIYGGDKRREFNDLKVGDLVRIDGRDTGRSTIDARAIYGLGYGDQPHDQYYGGVRLYGTVRSVDKRGRKLELAAEGRTQKITATEQTEVFGASGRRIELGDLGKGDTVSIQGYRSKGNEVVAEVIRAGGGYDWQGSGKYDSFEGRVSKETSPFDRKLRVRPTGWNPKLGDEVEIEVAKDAEVVQRGRVISVHDIHAGDTVYVEGNWSRSNFTAIRVEVGRSGSSWTDNRRGYSTIGGRIKEIDYRRLEFAIDTRDGEIRAYCDRARIYYNGREYGFEDLKKGDEVTITGNMSGSNIDVDRVETGRTSRWLDRRD